MMLIKIYRWLCGYLIIRVEGGSPERFINLCKFHAVTLWNMWVEDKTYYFCISIKDFKGINDIKEIEEVVSQYEGLARLSNTNAVDSGQQITRDDIPSYLKNVVSIQATSNVKRNVLFNMHIRALSVGKYAFESFRIGLRAGALRQVFGQMKIAHSRPFKCVYAESHSAEHSL